MPTKPTTEPDPGTFAGRRAERETREAIEGVPPRREFNHADYSSEFTVGNMTVRRVQA